MSIGERIEEFRLKNGHRFKTKKEFAKALSMPPEQLYLYVKNKRKPGADILQKLHNLGCDINWLLTGRTFDELSDLYNSLKRAQNINDAVAASWGDDSDKDEVVGKLKGKNAKIEVLIKELLDEVKNLL